MRSDAYNIKDEQQLTVTPAITLLMKQPILNVMLLVENTK